MEDYLNLDDFLNPVDLIEIAGDAVYKPDQMGQVISIYTEQIPDLTGIDIVLLGCGEQRGSGIFSMHDNAPNAIRKQFYQLYYWHTDIKIADIGNIKKGASFNDTYAALKAVLTELIALDKTVIILGGSHDLTLAQYGAYSDAGKIIDMTNVDSLIDLAMDSPFRSDYFLMDIFTGEPNFLRHYNHIGFQSYLVHPGMLQTLDKLKFDCYRVGHVKENLDEIEPAIRNSSLFTFDINAIANAFAPANHVTPNGLNGEEACTLMQYAGFSNKVNTIGIYGFDPGEDRDELTAKQISHMLWYAIDGKSRGRKEFDFNDKENYNHYRVMFSEVETSFLQSKKTGRWWMQMPNEKYIPCSYQDYLAAGRDEIPNRWFREQQREMN